MCCFARFVSVALVCLLSSGAIVQSQSRPFEIGGHVAWADSSEFDETDTGFGVRAAWRPSGLLGVEGELSLFPADFPDPAPFSPGRTEGLFGMTVGPRIGRVRPFAKLRAGFLTYREATEPVICIAIFPPPLSCILAAGQTLFALDYGGGAEIDLTGRVFARIDAGDRAVRYPGPAFDASRRARTGAFFGHDLRVTAGGGVRF